MRLKCGDEIALKRRWWLAATMLTGYVVVVAWATWLSFTLPGEGQSLQRMVIVLAMFSGCGLMAHSVVRDFWIRLDAEGVWQPTLVGWRGMRWQEVVHARAGRERIVLDSDSRSITINVGAFSHRERLFKVLKDRLPPHAVQQLEFE